MLNDWLNWGERKGIRGEEMAAFSATLIWWIAAFIVFYQCLWMLYAACTKTKSAEREQKRSMYARVPLLMSAVAVLALCTMARVAEFGRPFARQYLASTTISSGNPQFTVPASADEGAYLIPNVKDPEAKDPQSICPGYTASSVQSTSYGFTADLDLAGTACNLYGNDIEALTLLVEYQAADRLHVQVLPRYIGAENSTWFILPEELVPKPAADGKASSDGADSDLEFNWANEPTFGFNVSRRSTGDVLFTTAGTKLVFEDQFFEFASPLPENYNLYGLGEAIHGFKLNNNVTSK